MRDAGKDGDTAALKRVCQTTIFRWTHRSPQDLAPFSMERAALRKVVAPASKGLSLRRSRWMQASCRGQIRMSILSCR